MRADARREGRSDPLDPLQTLHRPERSVRLTVGHDPLGERRADAGQPVQLHGRRHIHINGSPESRGGRSGFGRPGTGRRPGTRRPKPLGAGPGARGPPATTRRQQRVHRGDLPGERRPVPRGRLRLTQRRTAPDPYPKRREGSDEQQRPMLCGGRHPASIGERPGRPSPKARRRSRKKGAPERAPPSHLTPALRTVLESPSPPHPPRSAASAATPCPVCRPACGARDSRGRSRRSPAAPCRSAAGGRP